MLLASTAVDLHRDCRIRQNPSAFLGVWQITRLSWRVWRDEQLIATHPRCCELPRGQWLGGVRRTLPVP
jgi:hypothetical protein